MTTPDTEVKPTDMTAGPWIVHYGEAVKIKDANGYTVASLSQIHLHGRRSKNEVEKTARFIVAACNAYEPMREALTAGLSQLKACREQLELYEQDASGETYNSPSLNTAIKVIDAALSTLPVNDRHHSGSDNDRLREALRELLAASDPARGRGTDRELDARERAVTALNSTDRQTSDDVGRLRELLEEELVWHEERDKSLSKQPQSNQVVWRRAEHQERIDVIRAALKGVPQPASDKSGEGK